MHSEEERLLALSRAGDPDAFGRLVSLYEERVYKTAYMLVGNRDDALDVSQDVFLKAYKNIRSFRGDCAFSTWLHRIAINVSRNFLRSARARKTVPEADVLEKTLLFEAKEISPEQAVIQKEAVNRLLDALSELPPEYKETLVLRMAQDLSYSEIADILDVPIGTVRSRLSKARELLFAKLRYKSFIDAIEGDGK